MDRYVNKDEALKAVSWDTEAYTAINMLHTVEVVRCNDCEYYNEDEKWCRRLGLCGAFNPDDFCSKGERRE